MTTHPETCEDRIYRCCETLSPSEHAKAYGYPGAGTEAANSYIPEGGVWTAAEREACMEIVANEAPDFSHDMAAAYGTVAALVRALEDSHTDHNTDREWTSPVDSCHICALLAAVKS